MSTITNLQNYIHKYNLNTNKLANYLKIHPMRICEILSGKVNISPIMDYRLCHFFKLDIGTFLISQINERQQEIIKNNPDIKALPTISDLKGDT